MDKKPVILPYGGAGAAIDLVEGIINDTVTATKDVPHNLGHLGVDDGINRRLRTLAEVKEELVRAGLRGFEALASGEAQPFLLLFVPDDQEQDTRYYGPYVSREAAFPDSLLLDHDTSGDWFIEPLRSPSSVKDDAPASATTQPAGTGVTG